MSNKTLYTKIVLWSETKTEWATINDILLKGEMGIELGENGSAARIKVGNGIDTFENLPYTTVNEAEVTEMINSVVGETVHSHENQSVLNTITATMLQGFKDVQDEAVRTISLDGNSMNAVDGTLTLPNYPTLTSLGIENVENTADASKTVAKAVQLKDAFKLELSGDVTGNVYLDGSQDVDLSVNIESLAASKLTGVIDIDRIPAAALERCVVVADDAARLSLTTDEIQKGDTVKVIETGLMYFVRDDQSLELESGYEVYTAGSASSVPWTGITDKPETFSPSTHTHGTSDITGLDSALDSKATKDELDSHSSNSELHVSESLLNRINEVEDFVSGDHARVDATKTEMSTINGNINIDGTEVNVYTQEEILESDLDIGIYKISVDKKGLVTNTNPFTKADIAELGVEISDTGIVDVSTDSSLTAKVTDRSVEISVNEVSTDLLTQGSFTLVLNGGRTL